MPHADGREETRDARALLRSRRREARPQPRAAGVDPQLPARLRVDEPERADVRELLLARIPNLGREDVVPAREAQQRTPPVARSPEVGDEHDERALARVRGDTGDPFTERGRAHAGARRLVPKGRKQPEQAHTPLPRGEHGGGGGRERRGARAGGVRGGGGGGVGARGELPDALEEKGVRGGNMVSAANASRRRAFIRPRFAARGRSAVPALL